jgi:beta-lactamase superfamily II metal-dependent hydrolase
MWVDIVNVEHGACAFIVPRAGGRLAMVDCGHNSSTGWRPSTHLPHTLKRTTLEYLFITNADHDHYSDLHDLLSSVRVQWFHRSSGFTSQQFLNMKLETGPLSEDAVSYYSLSETHSEDISSIVPPFNLGMAGVTYRSFCSPYGLFEDTNNLSMATFFHYNGFQILFPGDLQVPGWTALLADPAFRYELGRTTILVASHHGREDGFCADVFEYCKPLAVVMSDKPIEHGTQEGMAGVYGNALSQPGVIVAGAQERRKVLTTRNDGSIRFDVSSGTHFTVRTHYN